jgi:hypothetical protein
MRYRFLGLWVMLLPACGGIASSNVLGNDGGTTHANDASGTHEGSTPHDASSTSEGSIPPLDGSISCEAKRVPVDHRPTAMACPTARGPGVTTTGGPDGGFPGTCSRDSDCTSGKDGRCLSRGFGAAVDVCSYDQCYADSDCQGSVACVCRASPTDTAPNLCATGSDCRTDSDCGQCGFCSPSQSKSAICGQPDPTFFCHTSGDTCIDDKDCPGSTCNYDPTIKHWSCGYQCAPPPP